MTLGYVQTYHYKRKRIEAHVIICRLALTIIRILEQEVKLLNLAIDQAITEIVSAKAKVITMGNKKFVVPTAYTAIQDKILKNAQ